MNKLKQALVASLAFLTLLVILPPTRVAADINNLTIDLNDSNVKIGGQPINQVANYTPTKFVILVINILLGLSGILAFIMLVVGGVQWIYSGGDKDGTEKARKRITAALIGLAIVLSAYAIIAIFNSIFKINLFQFSVSLNDY